MKTKRRTFSPEFRRSVVDQIRNGASVGEVRRQHNISDSAIRKWMRKVEVEFRDIHEMKDKLRKIVESDEADEKEAAEYVTELEQRIEALTDDKLFLERMVKYFARLAWAIDWRNDDGPVHL